MALAFSQLFQVSKPVIGMIHLAGPNITKRVKRALEELSIYETEGVNGAIIEDYHGDAEDVRETLIKSSKESFKIVRGVNLLSDPYAAFDLASISGARFVQFDSVQTTDLNFSIYNEKRVSYPFIQVLGGVGFKYTKETGRLLETDLLESKSVCEAIVTTGPGTGVETPVEKLKTFKKFLGNFPLIVGAGVNSKNAYDQLMIADGAIVGSYFKPGCNTELSVDRLRVRDLIDIVKQARRDYVANC